MSNIWHFIAYLTRAKKTDLLNRPTSQKWIIQIDPSVAQLILLCYFWMYLHKRNLFRKFRWDRLRFCMRFCNLKVHNLVLKLWKVNRPTTVHSSTYDMHVTVLSVLLSQISSVLRSFIRVPFALISTALPNITAPGLKKMFEFF